MLGGLRNHFTAVLVRGLRDYNVEGQLGLEKTPEEYVAKMVDVFREVKRVLKKEGTVWLNLGDSYNGMKIGNTNGTYADGVEDESKVYAKTNSFKKEFAPGLKSKDLVGIPWRVAFALQADGWYLRQDIIWAKPNPMPESVTDRCTKSHEYIFLLAKSLKYYFDNEAIKEKAVIEEQRPSGVVRDRLYDYDSKEKAMGKRKGGGPIGGVQKQRAFGAKEQLGTFRQIDNGKRNKRSVWTVTTKPFKEAHFATFPEDLIVPMIKAGCSKGGIVMDIFMGAGTTAVVARKLGRNYLGIELNKEYIKIAEKRLAQQNLF